MTNEEKFFMVLQQIIHSTDDPRVKININVGVQLTEWFHKEADEAEAKGISNAIRDLAGREPGAKAKSKSPLG